MCSIREHSAIWKTHRKTYGTTNCLAAVVMMLKTLRVNQAKLSNWNVLASNSSLGMCATRGVSG